MIYEYGNQKLNKWGLKPMINKTKTQETTVSKNAPIEKFKSGLVCVNVWKNQGEEYAFYSVSIDISYKDKKGEWQKTNSCAVADIPRLILLLSKSYEYIIYAAKEE